MVILRVYISLFLFSFLYANTFIFENKNLYYTNIATLNSLTHHLKYGINNFNKGYFLFSNQVEYGVWYKQIYVSTFFKSIGFIKSNYNTVYLYYKLKNHLHLDDGSYKLLLKIYGYKANGIKIGSLYKRKYFFIRGGVNLLYAYMMQDLDGFGDAITKNSKSNYHSLINYYYTKNYIYDYYPDYSRGYGYSFYVNSVFHYKNIGISLKVEDLKGTIWWNNLPYSEVNINTQNEYYDDKGDVHYKSSIYGLEKNIKYTQLLKPFYTYKIFFKYKNFISSILNKRFWGFNWYIFELDYKNYSLNYNKYFKVYSLGFHNKNWMVKIGSNSLIFKRVNSFNVNLLFNQDF